MKAENVSILLLFAAVACGGQQGSATQLTTARAQATVDSHVEALKKQWGEGRFATQQLFGLA